MYKKTITTVTAIVLMVTIAFGQNKTYVGAQVGITYDVYELVDNGNGLKNVINF